MNSLKQSSTLPLKCINFNGIMFLVSHVSFHVLAPSLCDLEYRSDSPGIRRFWQADHDVQHSVLEPGQEAGFSLREIRRIARHCGAEEHLSRAAPFHVGCNVFWVIE